MRFAFSDEQREFQAAVKDLLANECPPAAVRDSWSNETGRVEKAWSALAEMGVLGMTAPADHGGLGMSMLDLILLLEETGYAGLPDPIVEHTAVAIPLLAVSAQARLQDALLPNLAEGELTAAIGGFAQEPVVAHARAADVLLFTTDSGVALCRADQCEMTEQRSVDGARRLFTLHPEQVEEFNVLADGIDASAVIESAFDRAALGTAAQLVGIAQRMLDMTVEYVKERHQFGVPIGSFQALKHQLADVRIALEFARPVVYRAAYSESSSDPETPIHISMAKAYANRAAEISAAVALQCHGAIGYTVECDLHMWLKRAWALQRAYGDDGFHLDRVRQTLA